MPLWVLPAITLPVPLAVPPIMLLLLAVSRRMPSPPLAKRGGAIGLQTDKVALHHDVRRPAQRHAVTRVSRNHVTGVGPLAPPIELPEPEIATPTLIGFSQQSCSVRPDQVPLDQRGPGDIHARAGVARNQVPVGQ